MGVFGGRAHNQGKVPKNRPCPQSITSKHNKMAEKFLGIRNIQAPLAENRIWEFTLATHRS